MDRPYQLQPTVDQVRILSGAIYFDFVRHTHIIQLPACDGATLLDVAISMFGIPATYPLGPYVRVQGEPFAAPSDVHLYFEALAPNGVVHFELTQAFIQKINALLRSTEETDRTAQYERGMQVWIDVLGRDPGVALVYGADRLVADRQSMALRLAECRTGAITHLGSDDAGSNGCLHVFNFLYNHISLPPLSLSELVAIANGGSQPTLKLNDVTQPRLIFSHGPSLLFDQSAPTPARSPTGGIQYTLECRYHNGLEDEFDSLETIIKTRMLELHKKLRPGGTLSDAITVTEDLLKTDISVKCTQLLNSLNSCDAQLKTIKTALDGVATKVDGLK